MSLTDLLSPILILIYIGAFVIFIVGWAEIFMKSGFSKWYCFLMMVPVINFICFLWFAYTKWPISDFVGPDWRIRRLQQAKTRLESEIDALDSLKSKDTKNELQKASMTNKTTLRQHYETLKGLSEDEFNKAFHAPDDSLQRQEHFDKGTKFKKMAEDIRKQIDQEST